MKEVHFEVLLLLPEPEHFSSIREDWDLAHLAHSAAVGKAILDLVQGSNLSINWGEVRFGVLGLSPDPEPICQAAEKRKSAELCNREAAQKSNTYPSSKI